MLNKMGEVFKLLVLSNQQSNTKDVINNNIK